MALNAKTANALDLTVPPSVLLLRADEVIEQQRWRRKQVVSTPATHRLNEQPLWVNFARGDRSASTQSITSALEGFAASSSKFLKVGSRPQAEIKVDSLLDVPEFGAEQACLRPKNETALAVGRCVAGSIHSEPSRQAGSSD